MIRQADYRNSWYRTQRFAHCPWKTLEVDPLRGRCFDWYVCITEFKRQKLNIYNLYIMKY